MTAAPGGKCLKAGRNDLLCKLLNNGCYTLAENIRLSEVWREISVDGDVAWLKGFIYSKTTTAGYHCNASISLVNGLGL